MSEDETDYQSGVISLTLCPCANTSATTKKPCSKPGTRACAGCYLVTYCSKECQTSDWKQHRVDCKSLIMKETWRPSWEIEGRNPAFVNNFSSPADSMTTHGKKKFLWGNVPALDMLNLEHNEGTTYNRDINLLFAASGDLRNVVKTISRVPPSNASTSQSFTAVLNDRDFDIVARNAIILLTALYVEPAPAAAATMLHTWYSALVPSSVLHNLHTTVLPLIRDVCDKVAQKQADKVLAKTWTRGRSSVRLVLEKRYWVALLTYFEVPERLTAAKAREVRTMTVLAEERRDYVDRALCCQPPGWRAATMRFRKDGVLLPFGASRSAFDTPNPTFFQEQDVWPMMDSADPLQGWPLEDVLRKTPVAKNDLYGGLCVCIQEILVEFCTRIQTTGVKFVLLHVDAVELPRILAKDFNLTQSFDRIEMANIADRGYLGLKCLDIFTPLLRSIDDNPHATLLTLFLNAISEVKTDADTLETMKHEMGRIVSYLPPSRQLIAHERSSIDGDSVRRFSALDLLLDSERLFAQYMRDCCFGTVSKHARLQFKPKHTLVKPWPLRLGKRATKADFEKLFGSGHHGHERYVEWQRAP